MKKYTYSLLVTLACCSNLWSEIDIPTLARGLFWMDPSSNTKEISAEEKKERQAYFDKISGRAAFDKSFERVRKFYTARLRKAIWNDGHINEIRSCIEDFGVDINQQYEYRWTPLTIAIRNSRDDVVELLLEKGVDVDTRDEREETPVMLAVVHNNINALKALISAGADVNAKDNRGETAYFEAAKRGNTEAIAILAAAGADANVKEKHDENTILIETLYFARAYHKNNIIPVMKALIEAGADVNAQNKHGFTVLEYAAWYAKDHKDFPLIIRTLVDAGANVNMTNNTVDGDSDAYKTIMGALKQHDTKK